jgi:hypothetical protein
MTVAASRAKGKLYRIMDFSRVVQIFESGSLFFAHPSAWEDPYEVRLRHAKSHAIFAQCWCQSGISDAMWRIYSPNGLGVRISTTKEKLEGAVKPWTDAKGYHWGGSEVEYEEQRTLSERLAAIRNDLAADFKIDRAADALFLKRESFQHEDEWRAVITCGDRKARRDQPKGISVPVDPNALVDNVLLDPRAPQELTNALGHYFTSKLGYPGVVKRSVLYKVPKPIIVDEDDL